MKLAKRLKLLKYLVLAYVVLLAITGIAQLILGTYIIWDHIIFSWLADNEFWKPVTILICIGPCSLFLCWLGWTATTNGNRRILGIFSVLLAIIVGLQLFLCVWSIKLRWSLTPRSSKFENSIDDSFAKFFADNSVFDSSHIWNKVQSQYKCCGVDGHTDYRRGAIPWSCFIGSEHLEDYTKINRRGCLLVVETIMRRLLLYCSFVVLVTALLQSVGLFCIVQLFLLLGQKDDSEEIDLAAMSFREKKAHMEMLQPLAHHGKGLNRKKFIEDSGGTIDTGTINV